MFQSRLVVGVAFLASVLVVQAQTVAISGTIIDSITSLPLANAAVSIVEYPAIKDTTDSQGNFALGGSTAVGTKSAATLPQNEITLHGDVLTLSNAGQSDATEVAVYDPAGRRVYYATKAGHDGAILTFEGLWRTPGLYTLMVRNNGNAQMFTCLGNGYNAFKSINGAANASSRLAKTNASYTISIAKPGYAPKQALAASAGANMGTLLLKPVAPTPPVTAMQIISQGVPAYASSNQSSASAANDTNSSEWNSSSAAVWLAYDLSSKPASARQNVLLVWYAAQTDYFFYNGASEPQNYTIEINNAPGGACPSSGWVTKLTMTGNKYSSRLHEIHMAGANWIRINISTCNSANPSIDMDIYDVSNGLTDAWLIMGDSNTQMSLSRWGTDLPNRAHAINHNAWPIVIGAGQGGTCSIQGLLLIDSVINNFPGKFIALNYGTNDYPDSGYFNRMDTLVTKIINAGRIPVVPTIPWRGGTDLVDSATVNKNANVAKLYAKYPQILKGPDQWTLSYNHTDLMGSLHWTGVGQDSVRQAWARTLASADK